MDNTNETLDTRKDEDRWIGVDFDGCLAHYTEWKGDTVGEPIPLMVDRVKKWVAEGKNVKILTARTTSESHKNIDLWMDKHFKFRLNITNIKDSNMEVLWDDRCVQVDKNEGTSIVERLQKTIEKMTDALMFYSDEENHKEDIMETQPLSSETKGLSGEIKGFTSRIKFDEGNKAREVLGLKQKQKEGIIKYGKIIKV